jgi:LysM repeat protein
MTDGPTAQPPRRHGPPVDPARDAASPGHAAADEPAAALERLKSLGSPHASAPAPESDRAGHRAGGQRPLPAAASGSGPPIARIAAPALFLVAVIVLISLLFQSGVIGGRDQANVAKPTPAATKAKTRTTPSAKPSETAGTSSIYVVKAGDTPSGIAEKYHIALSELADLNPDKDFTTLAVGEKLKVPTQ